MLIEFGLLSIVAHHVLPIGMLGRSKIAKFGLKF